MQFQDHSRLSATGRQGQNHLSRDRAWCQGQTRLPLLHRRSTLARLLVTCAMVLVACAAAHADSITLRASVRAPAGARTVTLGQVADLDGPEASRFASLEIAHLDDGAVEVPVTEIRRLLHEAGAHWGRIHLNGRRVVVRPRDTGLAEAPQAMTAASVSVPKVAAAPRRNVPESVSAATLVAVPTLRGRVAATVVRGLRCRPQDLRLRFDERDIALLDTPLDQMIFEIDPLSSFRSDRIDLGIRGWTDGTAGERHTVRVQPLLRTEVAALRRDIVRNDLLVADDLERTERWLAPSQASLICPPLQAVGRIAARSLSTGDVLHGKHVRSETVIERGDQLMVRCLVGGVAISMTAEARDDGAIGDAIACRKIGERNEFLATVTGPGEAVVDLARRTN